jgi:hypothetical protein
LMFARACICIRIRYGWDVSDITFGWRFIHARGNPTACLRFPPPPPPPLNRRVFFRWHLLHCRRWSCPTNCHWYRLVPRSWRDNS